MSIAHVLVLTAHPDDAEFTCSGVIAELTKKGFSVAICDATRGELGSRGTPETRAAEAVRASEILGVAERWNLDIPDGNITISDENIRKVIVALRHFRPELVLMPPEFERHLDHENMHRLVRTAAFQSGLVKIQTTYHGVSQQVHRPKRMLTYMQTYDFEPDFYVDISSTFEEKMASARAFMSQVTSAGNDDTEPQTFLSRPEFLEFLEARARYFGEKIGVRYAEAFRSVEPVGLKSLDVFLTQNT